MLTITIRHAENPAELLKSELVSLQQELSPDMSHYREFLLEIETLQRELDPYITGEVERAKTAVASNKARTIQGVVREKIFHDGAAASFSRREKRTLGLKLALLDRTGIKPYNGIVARISGLKNRVADDKKRLVRKSSRGVATTTASPSSVYSQIRNIGEELGRILSELNGGVYHKSAKPAVKARVNDLSRIINGIPDSAGGEVPMLKVGILSLVDLCLRSIQLPPQGLSPLGLGDKFTVDLPNKPKSSRREMPINGIEEKRTLSGYPLLTSKYIQTLLNDIRNVIAVKGSTGDGPFRQTAVSPFLGLLRDGIIAGTIDPENFSWQEVANNLEINYGYGAVLGRQLKMLTDKKSFKENLNDFLLAIDSIKGGLNITLITLQSKFGQFITKNPPPSR